MRVFKQKYRNRNGKLKDSAKWYVEFRDHQEVTQRIPGFTDKKLTQELGGKLEKLVASRVLSQTPSPELSKWLETMPSSLRKRIVKFGLLDSQTMSNSRVLEKHVDEFHTSLLDKGNTRDYSNSKCARVKKLLAGCRFSFYSEITPAIVQHWLAEQRKLEPGMSAQTSNFYLQALKQFCRWMVSERRASESPVAHLSGVNVKLDRRHDRRNLTIKEIERLLRETVSGPIRHRLNGRARAMLYRVAMETGLRRKELSALTPECIEFDSAPPRIHVAAGDVKNRQPTVQVIRCELAVELRRWIVATETPPNSPLWPQLTLNTAMMLRKDLDAAGIEYVDDAGLYADFHALRHSYVSLIVQGGAHPKIAQRLARHSDINLTMSRYSHTLLTDEADALSALPDFPSVFDDSEPQSEALRATGTDDARAESVLPPCLPEKVAPELISVQSDALSAAGETIPFRHSSDKNNAKNPSKQESFVANSSGEGGIRTHGTREGTLVFETSTFGHSVTSPVTGFCGALLFCEIL